MSDTYRDANCIEHMIEACRKIRRIASVSRADYDSSEEKQLALERLFEIIGEAASKVSDEFKAAHTHRSLGDRRRQCEISLFMIMLGLTRM